MQLIQPLLTLFGAERSSHCSALFTFANAMSPSAPLSWSRFCKASWGITLETNDELLLMILFLGFRRFKGSLDSLPLDMIRAGFPSPNDGTDPKPLLLVYGELKSLPALCDS